MLNWLSAGESHGEALVGILDGFPAGVEITTARVAEYLAERRLGHGRGARQKFEQDRVKLLGGVRHGKTTGAPIAVLIENSEWPKWETVMSPDPVSPESLLVDAGKGDSREIARNKPLTRPRPGHADFAGMLAYDLEDARPVLERASARETAMRVALGAFAQEFLRQSAQIELVSQVKQIGTVRADDKFIPTPADNAALSDSPVRCLDPQAEKAMIAAIDQAKAQGDTIGGVVEVFAYNVPIGLGTHTQHHRRLDARLAGELMSIQAVKSVNVGAGLAQCERLGSEAHDEFTRNENGEWVRKTNLAGGIEGGMSSGNLLHVSCALKPISTVPHALETFDFATGDPAKAIHQRSDACAVVPAAVIAQAEVALVLADALLERFGGYSLKQVKAHLEYNAQTIQERF